MEKGRKCSIDNCENKHYGLGLCSKHYRKYKKYGDPNVKKNFHTEDTRTFIDDALSSDVEECIIWPFVIHNTGYGKMQFEKREINVHRYVCLMTHGEPAKDRNQAAHSCGNRKCINPKHLRWATKEENEADKLIHGTIAMGTRLPQAKLNEETVKEILNSEESGFYLADKYGISPSSIYRIRHGISWKHVSKD